MCPTPPHPPQLMMLPHPWPRRDGCFGLRFFRAHEFMSRPGHSERPPGSVRVRGNLKKPRIKNMTAPVYQHVLANSVTPRIKTLAADWQLWEFAEGATDIEYGGEYGSERAWIVSGRGTGHYRTGGWLALLQCGPWRRSLLPERLPMHLAHSRGASRAAVRLFLFCWEGDQGHQEVTCDVCGCGCYEESYLYNDEMDICPRCFKLDAKSSQQYEDTQQQRWGKPVQ